MSVCAYCQSEVHDQVICPRCQRITSSHLADIPEHVAELTTVLTKDTVYAEKSDGGKSADPTIAWAGMGDRFLSDVLAEIDKNPIATPYARSAAAVLHELRATLVSWTRLLNDQGGVPLPADTLEALAEHLRGNLRILASHEAAGEFVAEVTNLVKRVMVVIDSPEFRTHVQLGPCVERIDEDLCTGTVVARIYADATMLGNWQCQRCKREWPPTDWPRVGAQIMARKEAA